MTTPRFRRICVFCGSSPGARPAYAAAAEALGRRLAEEGITLVYGGGAVGLMGVTADAALAAGGAVIGVIPRALKVDGIVHRGLSELHVVPDMHARKALMADLADAFIALPGGLGTLEELFEALTWAQLGFHAKPCGLLDVDGFYDALTTFLDHAAAERFIRREHRAMLSVAAAPETLLAQLAVCEPPPIPKWMDRASDAEQFDP